MSVIGPDLNRAQLILPMKADFTNCLLNHVSLLCVKRHRLMLQLASLGYFKTWLAGDARRSVNILLAIHRSPLITVQPRTITAKCDEVSQRKLVIVKVSHR